MRGLGPRVCGGRPWGAWQLHVKAQQCSRPSRLPAFPPPLPASLITPSPPWFAPLQENSVNLSGMKASKFFVVFEQDITYWEKTLSHISETVEMILQVGKGGQEERGDGRGV